VCFFLSEVHSAELTTSEKAAYTCVLEKAQTEDGNPVAAAYNTMEICPMSGMTDVQIVMIVDLTVRKLMDEYGMKCIGTGCG
jgi:hypothetical protein